MAAVDTNMETPEAFEATSIRTFDVTVKRVSQSKNVYLFNNDGTGELPTEGKIILLKKDSKPEMGLRVIKTYPEHKKFAARRLNKYGSKHILINGDSYNAIIFSPSSSVTEPLTTTALSSATTNQNEPDTTLEQQPPVPPTAQLSDLNENTPPPSGDVVKSPLPETQPDEDSPPIKEVSNTESDDDAVAEHSTDLAIEELQHLETNSQWLTGFFGYFWNQKPSGAEDDSLASVYLSGIGIRHTLSLGKLLIFRQPALQDGLLLENSFSFYKLSNFVVADDAYTIAPVSATLRYNMCVGEAFSMFLYGGLVKNFILASENSLVNATDALGQILPAAGLGIAFRIGPSWDMRIDMGVDIASLGLMIGF